MGGGRLGVKNCGRWEIGGQKLWEVGDGHPCVTPLLYMQLRTRHCAIPRPTRDNRLYVTDYTQRPQQVIGLGHQTQAFIQMPLIFMNGDVIWTCKQMISEEPSFSVMLRYKYTINGVLSCKTLFINFNITLVFFIKMK